MSRNITVTAYGAEDRTTWDAFNTEARNGHFLFDRGFMDYHADRFVDHSLVMHRDSTVIGLLPANIRQKCVQSHGGLTFGGLIVGNARLEDVCEMLDLAAERWQNEGLDTLLYKPLPTFYHRRPSQDDLFWLALRGARLIHRNVSTTIDLDTRGVVSNRRRRGASKAEKAGLRFVRAEDWKGYWFLLERVLGARHEIKPVHRIDEIERLATAFPDSIQLHVAVDDEEILAGVVLFVDRGVWHAQYIASGERGRSTGALDGLFVHLIDAAGVAGARFFDFGISTEQGGTVLNTGLLTQKEEFGGSATCYDTYAVDLCAVGDETA